MALSNATLQTGATITVSGGSTLTFVPSGGTTAEQAEIIDSGQADVRLQTRITARSTMPSYNSTLNTYSKGKRTLNLKVPKVIADGTTQFPTLRIEFVDHPEQTAAERLDMRKLAAQMLVDADFETFFTTGSKA